MHLSDAVGLHMPHRGSSECLLGVAPECTPTAETKCSSCSAVHHTRLATTVLGDLICHDAFPTIGVCLRNLILQVHNGLGWVQAFRAAIRAIHDAMATVELHGVIYPSKALLGELVPGIGPM